MIDVKELRMGNYVQNEKSALVQIDGRRIFDLWCKTGILRYNYIPLTEELLIKLGFEKLNGRHGEYFYHHVCTLFRVWTNDGVNFSAGRKDEESNDRQYNTYWIKHRINQVHDLQNLFYAITSSELIIK